MPARRVACAPVASPTIDFDQFLAVDMRVGRGVAVGDFPEGPQAGWKPTIDFGPQIGEKRASGPVTD